MVLAKHPTLESVVGVGGFGNNIHDHILLAARCWYFRIQSKDSNHADQQMAVVNGNDVLL